MAQAIRRKNIAAVQLRRNNKKVRTYVRAAFNAALGILGIFGMFAIPYLVEAIASPKVQAAAQILHSASGN